MSTDRVERGPRVRMVLLIYGVLPSIIAAFVLAGAFFGFYLTEAFGSRDSLVFPLIFSFLGLVLSLLITFFIAKRVSGEYESKKDKKQ